MELHFDVSRDGQLTDEQLSKATGGAFDAFMVFQPYSDPEK
jgi:hypothetical protein